MVADALDRLWSTLIREARAVPELSELSLGQRRALGVAAKRGPLRLGALAEQIGTSDATASRTVDALVRAGLLHRDADPGDRRSVLIGATATGLEAVSARRAALLELLGDALAGVEAGDRARLAELLDRLSEALERPAVAEAS